MTLAARIGFFPATMSARPRDGGAAGLLRPAFTRIFGIAVILLWLCNLKEPKIYQLPSLKCIFRSSGQTGLYSVCELRWGFVAPK